MSEPDGFLARWSRRKQEARREEPAAPVEPPRPAEPAGPVQAEPEALPELPPIESITAETDISVFLAKGVADSIRNAALRRMWSLDPAIRDYVGDARDYAYDWNTPGGVPGFGAIEPGYDIEGTIARMFGQQEPEAESVAADEQPAVVAASDDPALSEGATSVGADAGHPPLQSMAGAPDLRTQLRNSGVPEFGGERSPEQSGERVSALSGGGAPPSPQPSSIGGEGDVREPARVNTPRHGRATPV